MPSLSCHLKLTGSRERNIISILQRKGRGLNKYHVQAGQAGMCHVRDILNTMFCSRPHATQSLISVVTTEAWWWGGSVFEIPHTQTMGLRIKTENLHTQQMHTVFL